MPLSSRLRWTASLLFVLALLATALPAHARVDPPHPPVDPHHVDGSSIGGPIDLSSTWLVKQGDDPGYSSPQLDDSKWTVITVNRPLNRFGLKDVDAIWYRTHVHLPTDKHNLALLMRNFEGSEEFYANGMLLGSFGTFAGNGKRWYDTTDVILQIPEGLIRAGDLTIAIRARIGKDAQFGAVTGGLNNNTLLLLGTRDDLVGVRSLRNFRSYTSSVTNLTLELLLSLVALSLAMTLRSEREYLALFIYTAAQVVEGSINFWRDLTNTPNSPFFLILGSIFITISLLAYIEFLRIVLRLRRTRLLVIYYGLLAFVLIVVFQTINIGLLEGPKGYSNGFIAAANVFAVIVTLPVGTGLPLLALWTWWKRRSTDALLLFIPLLLQNIVEYTDKFYTVLYFMGLRHQEFNGMAPIQGLYVAWGEITDFIATITLLLFIVLRTLRIARAKAATAAEIAAAQTVQQVLLARSAQPTPGFDVETVYRPASEVGGDFFLVSPGSDGSLVAIVGDVSGKGLIAAMRVSMILGVLRREESREPAAVLRGLNEALLLPVTDARSAPGFTTACCIRLEHSGQYSIANAGHIAPYIDGAEIPTAAALPLGLAGDQEYEVASGRLTTGKKLVLMSDGVVEARSASGELYGFDRTALLTLRPAVEIAETAANFGQEDDITVLTIACCA